MSKRIAILDLETDPFQYGRMVHPFVAGFYDGHQFKPIWSPNCIDEMYSHLQSLTDEYIVYAHNGGRFDFFWFLPYIQKQCRIINGRIVQAFIGKQELRDSFAIMPFALEQYKKTPIDYNKFTPTNREKNKNEIIAYLKDDCTDLYDLCSTFHKEFGPALTIGTAAMKQLKRFHTFATGNDVFDARFRDDFYFGGRNQVFKAGVINGPIHIYDVNSMYPHAMRDYLHPVSTGIINGTKIDNKTAYITVEGKNYGAFPVRQKDHSLDFTVPSGIFHTTIHEYIASQDTGTFKTTKIHRTIGFNRRETFSDFVNHFYDARQKSRADGDKIRTLFYKFVLNSAYGKFAQDPKNYCDWFIAPMGEMPTSWHQCEKSCDDECRKRWSPSFISNNNYIIWSRPLQELHYFNIATGASITGAARAMLLRGLHNAIDPMYCDTDSIICRGLKNLTISDTELGAWKLETIGSRIAIAGKKMYAVYDENGATLKKAHKGMRLSGEEILKITLGETVESCNPVPAFKFDGTFSFTKRLAKRTA